MIAAELVPLVQDTAKTYGLPYNLLVGQILEESSGDPDAFRFENAFWLRYIKENPKANGAKYGPLAACSFGLLQLMLETALEMGFTGRPEDLFTPEIGLTWGAHKMAELWKWAGGSVIDYPKALAAYNEGPANALHGPPFADQGYVDRIFARAGTLT